jgi:hypothetical protein
VLLEMIPLVNFISPMSNVIGSALWASDIDQYAEANCHPRAYLLAPSAILIEQGQVHYGTGQTEKDMFVGPPPDYEQAMRQDIRPSAPPSTDKQ